MPPRNRRTTRQRRRKKLPLPDERRDSRPRAWRIGRVFLLVFLVMIPVNLYAFFWGRRSLRSVYRSAQVSRNRQSTSGKKDGTGRSKRPARRSLLNLRLPKRITDPAAAEAEEALLDVEAHTVQGLIRRGDNLYRALKRLGVGRLQGDTIVRTLSALYDFRRARPGQRFSVRLSSDRQRLLSFEFQANAGEIYQITRQGKELQGRRVQRPIETRVFEIATSVRGSLWSTLNRIGEDGRLLASFVAIFSWDMNLYTDVKKGDLLRIIVEKQYMGERFYRYGRILAAEFVGQRQRVRAFWYRPARGSGGYYDESGLSLHRQLLRTPLKYKRISSQFDPGRMHPILHVVRAHRGVDYAAPRGTPIWAVARGEVIYVGRNRAAGKMIVIDHGDNMRSIYMHLQGFHRAIKKGTKVRQRQTIGYVGSTGMATGPHLHFGLKINGVYVDPIKVKRRRLPPVDRRHKADFIRCITPLSGTLNTLKVRGRPIRRLAAKSVVKVADRYRSR